MNKNFSKIKGRLGLLMLSCLMLVLLAACSGKEVDMSMDIMPTPTEGTAPSSTPVPTKTDDGDKVKPTEAAEPTKAPTPTPLPVINDYSGEIAQYMPASNEAIDFVSGMTVGFNLGNEFDATGEVDDPMMLEYYWTGAKTTDAFLETVRAAGFNTIRIPVSWHDHVDADFNIDPEWMARVKEVVDKSVNTFDYVILNCHHDVHIDYYYPSTEKYEQSEKYFQKVWTQISENFEEYDNRLIFEAINEPRLVGTNYEWWFNTADPPLDCLDSMECMNLLNQVFVDTVRASGGNNQDRFLMVCGYDTSPDKVCLKYFRLPEDSAKERLIVTAHSYSPYNFAQNLGDGSTTEFDIGGMNENKSNFKMLYDTFVAKGIPVVMGEFGCFDKSNTQDCLNYYSYVVGVGKSYCIPCAVWDNNAFNTDGTNPSNAFGLINRETCEIVKPQIIEAMMQYFR